MKRFAFAVVVSFVASSSFAQQVSETVNVEVIQVPVYVVGPDGNPIRGLTKDAFHIYVDGFEKPIDYFDPVDLGAPLKVSEHRPERERRLYLLLFDLSCARDDCKGLPGRIARAQKAAGVAVDRSHEESDLFAVATYTLNHGVQFATPFLRDRVALRRAISTLSSGSADPLGLTLTATERANWMREEINDASQEAKEMIAARNDQAAEEIRQTLIGSAANQDNVHQPIRRELENEFENFGAVAQRLAMLEGQKHVILFSQGFDSAIVHGGENPVAPLGSAGGTDARANTLLQQMFEAFQGAGVFLDAVDIVGLRPDFDNGFANDSLQMLAHGTGGEFVRNRNDFTSAITDLTVRQQITYLLGFDRRDLMHGKISVRVDRVPRGTRLSYRQGFGPPAGNHDIDPLQLADIVVNDLPQTGVNMAVGVQNGSLLVGISRKEVLPQLVAAEPWIETILYVFDQSGTAVVAKQKRITFDEKTKKQDGPIVIGQRLQLPPGQYVAKAITRIGGTTSVGYAKALFKIQ